MSLFLYLIGVSGSLPVASRLIASGFSTNTVCDWKGRKLAYLGMAIVAGEHNHQVGVFFLNQFAGLVPPGQSETADGRTRRPRPRLSRLSAEALPGSSARLEKITARAKLPAPIQPTRSSRCCRGRTALR